MHVVARTLFVDCADLPCPSLVFTVLRLSPIIFQIFSATLMAVAANIMCFCDRQQKIKKLLRVLCGIFAVSDLDAKDHVKYINGKQMLKINCVKTESRSGTNIENAYFSDL